MVSGLKTVPFCTFSKFDSRDTFTIPTERRNRATRLFPRQAAVQLKRETVLLNRNNPQDGMFFQIHKNGSAVDGVSYASLAEASAALDKAGQGGEVTAVNGFDQIVRRYTVDECRAARKSRHKA